MAIEPIKGFYVHDEVTDTDGVAKYDFEELENAPNIRELESWYSYADETKSENKRYAMYSSSSIGLVDYAYGDAYKVPLHGSDSIKISGYHDASTWVIYEDADGVFYHLESAPVGLLTDTEVSLPTGSVYLYITLQHGYENGFKVKSLLPLGEVSDLIEIDRNFVTYGTSQNTNQFPGHVTMSRGLDVESARISTTYGNNIAGDISTWDGDNDATFDGSKWSLGTGDTIHKSILVENGKEYLVTLSVNGAVSPSETPAPQKIMFGTNEYEFFGADDANWDVAVEANTTGSITVTIGNTNWSGNITNITIRPVEYKSYPVEYLNNKAIYAGSYNIAIGNGNANLLNGDYNTALGVNAQGLADTGDGNTAIGALAQYEVGNGSRNTAVGQSAQQKIHTGMYNHAFGYASQQMLDSGCWNVAMGNESQRDITTGCNNVGLGRRAQNSITSGSQNIAIGALAGFARGEGEDTSQFPTTTAKDQVLIGYQATAYDNEAQYDNIVAIGSRATSKNNGTAIGTKSRAIGNNSVAIGYLASAIDDNTVVLGNGSVSGLIVGNKRIIFNNDGTVTWETVT